MNNTNLVVNSSKGYNYNYASLADIVAQGYKLPKMKTVSEGSKEYVCYFDTELCEWIRGAEVVIPEGKGMNKAQIYGSALTYARRYTALLALQLACQDDEVINEMADEPLTTTQVKNIREVMGMDMPKEVKKVAPTMTIVKPKPNLTQAEINHIIKTNKLKTADQITDQMFDAYLEFKAKTLKERERKNANSNH